MLFIDCNHFIGFGKFVSFDLRIKVRNLVSGRCVHAFAVSTVLTEGEVLSEREYELVFGDDDMPERRTFQSEVVYDRLKSLIVDLANLVLDKGYENLYDYLYQVSLNSEVVVRNSENAANGVDYLVGELFSMNHLTAWEVTVNPAFVKRK